MIALQQEHLQKTVRLKMFSLAETVITKISPLSSRIKGQRICLWKTSRNWPFKDLQRHINSEFMKKQKKKEGKKGGDFFFFLEVLP